MELKKLAIGKIVKVNGIRLQVTKAVQGCRGCYFKREPSCHPEVVGVCCPPWRRIAIIFRKYDEHKRENLHQALSRGKVAALKITRKWKD